MKSFAVHAFIAIVLAPPLYAQSVPTDIPDRPIDALNTLSRTLSRVRDRFGSTNQARNAIQTMDDDVKWLIGAAPRWPMNENTAGFSRSITYTTALLRSLLEGVRRDVQPVLDIARRDIHLNFLQCRMRGGPSPVSVRVATRTRGNQEVSGYEVWYVRKAFENVGAAFRRFERNSSPTERIFREAGYYVLWVEQQAPDGLKRRGPRLDLEIGVDASKQIDLHAP
jgi:hypothetical protein